MLFPQSLPWPVRIRRWWASPTHWILVIGAAMNAMTAFFANVGVLGLPGPLLLAVVVAGNVVIYLLGAVLNYFTTTIIGDRHEVAAVEGRAHDN